MGGKKGGENTRKAAGNAKKRENEAKKQAEVDLKQEKAEASKWEQGAKDGSKKQAAAEKKAEQAAKKLEAKQLLAAEESSQPAKGKGAGKKVAEKKSRGTLDLSQLDGDSSGNQTPSALNATGIDNALDALSLTASANEVQIDRHPERRKEAAYQAYAAWREEELKTEEPGLRGNQRVQRMRKEFEKRPENPMNQLNAGHYAASKADMAAQKDQIRSAAEERLTQPNRSF